MRSPGAEAARPPLLLLTSLPIAFPERFGIGAPTAPLMARLEAEYAVEPIAAAEPGLLRPGALLLMIQPRAQPAELLVALDAWVRRGGRVLLLADPKLEFESVKPLGDLSRPPVQYPDTGLLAHWGLTLGDKGKSWGALSVASKGCALDKGARIARCAIGRGRVTVVADADLAMASDAASDLLMNELARLNSL